MMLTSDHDGCAINITAVFNYGGAPESWIAGLRCGLNHIAKGGMEIVDELCLYPGHTGDGPMISLRIVSRDRGTLWVVVDAVDDRHPKVLLWDHCDMTYATVPVYPKGTRMVQTLMLTRPTDQPLLVSDYSFDLNDHIARQALYHRRNDWDYTVLDDEAANLSSPQLNQYRQIMCEYFKKGGE